jgi:outer membrane protein assembly factor BamB
MGMFQAGDTTPAGYWSDFIVAVNVDTGKIVWRKTMSAGPVATRFGGRILGGSLSAGDVVFAADPDGDLYAFDAATGKTEWHYRVGSHERPSLVASVVDWTHWAKRTLFREADPPASPARIDASPIVYVAGGREYVAIAADILPSSKAGGAAITAFALPKP